MKIYVLLCVLFFGIGIAVSGRVYSRDDDDDDDDDDGDDGGNSQGSSEDCDESDDDTNCVTVVPPPVNQCPRTGTYDGWTLTSTSELCRTDSGCERGDGSGYCGTERHCCHFTGCAVGYYGVLNGCTVESGCTLYPGGICAAGNCCYPGNPPAKRALEKRKLARQKLARRTMARQTLEKLAKEFEDLY